MKNKSGFMVLLSTACLFACSSEPDAGDVKANFEQIFKSCSVLSIKDVKKTNGRPGPDGSYLLNVQYTIAFTPVKETVALYKEFKEVESKVNPKVEKLRSDFWAEEAKEQALYKARRDLDENSPEYRDMNPTLDSIKEAKQSIKAELEQTLALLTPYDNLSEKFRRQLGQNCQFPAGKTRYTGLQEFVNNGYAQEQERSYTAELPMIKTEKGWMFQGFL